MEEELERIEHEIRKKKARWRAGKTRISSLSPEKRRKRLGLKPTKEELRVIHELGLDKPAKTKKGKTEDS